jgi:histidinol-phosphate aminotransferase
VTSTSAASGTVGPPPGMRVRLSSNESPFGPSPAVVEAATAAVRAGHRYPDDQSVALRRAIAAHERRTPDEVAVGTGSAGLLMDAIAEVAPGGSVLTFERSFIVYRLAAANAVATYVEAPTGPPPVPGGEARGYARDVEALLERVDDTTRVVVIDNPGNPTGTHLDGDALATLVDRLDERILVIVDEAYHQFATGQRGYRTVDELGLAHPRVVVVRTFSKAYALAGLRIGYLLGPAALVRTFDDRRVRFNVTAPAQAAALASLADTDHLAATVAGTLTGRERMADGLRALGVPFTDGLGNFLTVELGTDAGPVIEAFAACGVGVRELTPYRMAEQLRVSVGTPEEVEVFLEAAARVLDTVPARG